MKAVQKQHVNHPNTWRKAFIGTIDDISAAAQWVDTVAVEQQFPEQLVFALQVCLEELLTNVVRHGGAKSSGDRIWTNHVCIQPLNQRVRWRSQCPNCAGASSIVADGMTPQR